MTFPGLVGVVGVLCILIAYAGATAKKMGPAQAPALLLNLTGALLILVSLYFNFNLSAVLMEGAWALVAIYGLLQLILGRNRTSG